MDLSFKKTAVALLFGPALGYASALNVYQDMAEYTFAPKDGYIGFAKSVKASCKNNEVMLAKKQACPHEERLCKAFLLHEKTKYDLVATTQKLTMLDKLVSFSKSTDFDPKAWIEGSELLGERSAALMLEQERLKAAFAIEEEAFFKQAPSADPLYLAEGCQEDTKLTFPYGQIGFSTFYEAEFLEENQMRVTHYLSVRNHSGVDIKADSAMFYYRPARRYIDPIHFTPWVVSKYAPKAPQEYRTATAKMAPMAESAAIVEEMGTDKMPLPEVSYEDARVYQVKNLSLPSLGIPVDMPIVSWEAPADCKIYVYPYANTTSFTLCAFKPAYQIDTHRWKIKSDGEIINDHAIGEYYKGMYQLYANAEEDIQVLRRPIVQNEKNIGFFGNTVRKKDGFTLEITNKSNKPKTLNVIERFPVSSAEEIKVKLLSVSSTQKVDYEELKEGRIKMKIDFKANESKKIEVLFEISYDKELDIEY